MANRLGDKIKCLRMKKGLTLEQLAGIIGSGKSYIWEVENKGIKSPSAVKLILLAKALDVTTEFLLDNAQRVISDDQEKEVIYRKFSDLIENDRRRILDLMDAWSAR